MNKDEVELLVRMIDAMPPPTPRWVIVVTFALFAVLLTGVAALELGWWG